MQRLAELGGLSGRHEDRVDAVACHVAVAGDVGAHDGRAGRERLGEHHAEALAAERRRHQQVGLVQQAPLLGLARTRAGHLHALVVEQERLDLLAGGARDGEPGIHAGGVQRLERAQQHGQALALVGAAHVEQPQLVAGGARALCGAAERSTPFGTIL